MRQVKKFFVESGIIPSHIKIQKLIKAYGELYLDIFEAAKLQNKLTDLSKMLLEQGKKNGELLRKELA